MIAFILGSLFGGAVGVFTMCLCVTAKEADRELEYTDPDE